jgi:hypothetical protein
MTESLPLAFLPRSLIIDRDRHHGHGGETSDGTSEISIASLDKRSGGNKRQSGPAGYGPLSWSGRNAVLYFRP